MTNTLRIPDEPRFVRAFALAVDPGDTLTLLMEIGALGGSESSASLTRCIGIVRRTREALVPAYDRASDLKNWEQTHTISVLREALAWPDAVAYLAYHVRDNHSTAHPASEYAEALAVIGCAADSLSTRRRPWEIEPDDLSLPEWRHRVQKLLFALPGTALPQPSTAHTSPEAGCTCHEPGNPAAIAGDHAPWRPACHDEGAP